MIKNRFKSKRVAIVGAGITGLYLAWKLSERGNIVTIFEKKNKIGKEACSGLFSEKILKFIPQSEKLIKNQINSVLIHFPKKTIKIEFAQNFFVMNHAELDRLAGRFAQESGCQIIFNQNVSGPVLDKLKNDFELIVGCDGANSEVRKFLGLSEPEYRLGILGFVSRKNSSNFVETWPLKQKTGFIWKIPRAEETEYGIIAKPKEAKMIFDDFLDKNKIGLERISSSLIPQGFVIPKNNKITLCGDAAGLTKPWSGGGVIWGLQASDILLKNFPNMLRYRQAVKRFFLPQIVLSKIASKLIYFLGFNFPWFLPTKIKMEGDYVKSYPFRYYNGRQSKMGSK